MMALARAQMQDMIRNPMLPFFFACVPIIGAVMQAAMPASVRTLLSTALFVMSAYFAGWTIPAFTLAEEKEKRQLESLFLTPVRPWQVVLVKGGFGLVGSVALGLLMFPILGASPQRPLLWLASYTVLALFAVGIGTLVGLLVKDMRSLGVGGTPVVLVFIFATTLPWALMQPGVWTAMAWLPTRPAVELIAAGITGEAVPVVRNLLVMLAYVTLLLLLNARLIRRLSFARH